MHKLRAAVVALALVTLATACTTTTTSSDETTDRTQRAGDTLTWSGCGNGLECATLTVPLDHAVPDGRQVDLAVARRPAGEPEDRIGILVMNPGGPGGSGIETMRADPFTDELHQRFDIVSWDPRGVGDSVPLDCEPDDPGFVDLDPHPDTAEEQAALDASGAALAEDCAQADLELLDDIGTTATVADIDALRVALGEDQISFLGFSYGTLLGQEYARAYPNRVRALVLDGVVDPAETLEQWLTIQGVSLEAWLGDMTADYDELMTRLEVAPMRTSGVVVGPDDLVLGVVAASYDPDGKRVLGEAMDRALDGNVALLASVAKSYTDATGSYATYVAVVCTDSPRPIGNEAWRAMAARAEDVAPRMGAAVVNEIIGCASWQTEPTRTPAPVEPPQLAPALVIANTGDVATPIAGAERVAARLPGAVLLTVDTDGHTATASNPCAAQIVTRYLIDLELPDPGTVCPV